MTFGDECNCGDCPAIGCKQHGFNSQYPEETQHFSQKKGCLSHPRAREVLMVDVVEELERVRQSVEKRYHSEVTDMSERNYWKGKNNALFEVIDLIRGGK